MTYVSNTYWALIVALAIAGSASASETIENSRHDLSVQSPNAIRAVNENQICVFCHAPHSGDPLAAGWNRHTPSAYYRVYRSTTTSARSDQPGFTSRMCLSCHDGTLPLGQVLDRPATDPIPMTIQTMPPGPFNLTTDLSNDHPISFRYDRALSNADPQLYDPQRIARQLVLGRLNEVTCLTCHDPHNNDLGNFLRVPEKRGALCLSCHNMFGWHQSAHATSPAGVHKRIAAPAEALPYSTVADNACASCHKVHNAPRKDRLLRYQRDEENCTACHDGSVAGNILGVLGLPYNHRGTFILDRHSPAENPRTMPAHVTCVDCHNPHAVQRGLRSDNLLRPRIGTGPLAGAPGVSAQGRLVRHAQFEYEVCLRCHGDNPVQVRDTIARVVPSMNLRREITFGAASSHPFVRSARNLTDVPSLSPAFSGKQISCSDCHNSNQAKAFGGAGPNGPHGSIYKFLVALEYDTGYSVPESAQAYALCYRCHSRTSILSNQSFSLHRQHVVTSRVACSACHEPHGNTANAHLINFDRSQVSAVAGSAGIQYRSRGRFTGSCTLVCHNVNHVNFIYSPTAGGGGTGTTAASMHR